MDSYPPFALGWLHAHGCRAVELWCIRWPCTHWKPLQVRDLLARFGPGAPLVMLARRARCTVCGSRGAHVQPVPPPAGGVMVEFKYPGGHKAAAAQPNTRRNGAPGYPPLLLARARC